MKTLILGKLRNKYGISPSSNLEQDIVIQSEVEIFLNSEQLTEANLVKLDKKL
jgi:hypothetical protein